MQINRSLVQSAVSNMAMVCCILQSSLTMVLVLVQPFVAVVCEQLVLAKRCVNEAIHEGRGQIHTSRVHLGATASKPCRIQRRGYTDQSTQSLPAHSIQLKHILRNVLTVVLQMCFVDVIRHFGFHDVQLRGKRQT